MAKNPVLPLYYNDISRSTSTWTDEEFGAYMRLLMEQWDKGFIPNDYQRLTRLCTSLDTNWSMLKEKFPEGGGGLQNKPMELIREKLNKFKEKQKQNVSKRYQKSTKPNTKNLPLEIENEIENENINENKTVLLEMLNIWKNKDLVHTENNMIDFREVAERIISVKDLGQISNEQKDGCLQVFEKVAEYAKENAKYYGSISSTNKHLDKIINAIKKQNGAVITRSGAKDYLEKYGLNK